MDFGTKKTTTSNNIGELVDNVNLIVDAVNNVYPLGIVVGTMNSVSPAVRGLPGTWVSMGSVTTSDSSTVYFWRRSN